MPNLLELRRTLWLADHQLADLRGHHYNFNCALAKAASEAGLGAAFLCRRDFDFSAPSSIHVSGIFRPDWRSAPPPWLSSRRRGLDLLEELSRRRFLADLHHGLDREFFNADDIVFAQMLSPRHLDGWLRWRMSRPAEDGPLLAFHLGYDPSRFAFHSRLSASLNQARRILSPSDVLFASDSDRLATRYAEILKFPVATLPHVVSPQLQPQPLSLPLDKITFAALGNPRQEKGFAEIAAAIRILNQESSFPGHFLIQANDPDPVSAPLLEALQAAHYPNVTFVGQRMSEAEYIELLHRAGVVLLPYHLDTYRDRTSGVLCEALVAARPIIATRDSWMSAELQRAGLGWACEDRSAASLAQAMREAQSGFAREAGKSAELAPYYRGHFSGASFIEKLLELADAK